MPPSCLVQMASHKVLSSAFCEERLHRFDVNCTIADIPYVTKAAESNFWIDALFTNTTYQGLVLGTSCPVEYCKTAELFKSLWTIQMSSVTSAAVEFCVEVVQLTTASHLAALCVKSVLILILFCFSCLLLLE